MNLSFANINNFFFGKSVAVPAPTEADTKTCAYKFAANSFKSQIENFKRPENLVALGSAAFCDWTALPQTIANTTLIKTSLDTVASSVKQATIKETKGSKEGEPSTYAYESMPLTNGLWSGFKGPSLLLGAFFDLQTVGQTVRGAGEFAANAVFQSIGTTSAKLGGLLTCTPAAASELNSLGSLVTGYVPNVVPHFGTACVLAYYVNELRRANALEDTNVDASYTKRVTALTNIATVAAQAVGYNQLASVAATTLGTIGGIPTGLLVAGGIAAITVGQKAHEFYTSRTAAADKKTT